jgi:hypothetical protein
MYRGWMRTPSWPMMATPWAIRSISRIQHSSDPIRMGKVWIGQATWVGRLIWREPSVIYRSSVRKPVPGDAQLLKPHRLNVINNSGWQRNPGDPLAESPG